MKAALGSVKSKVIKTKKHDNVDAEFEELRTKFDEIAASQAIIYKNLQQQDTALAALGDQTLALSELFQGRNGAQDNALTNDYRTAVTAFVQLLNHNKEDCSTAFTEVETHKTKRKEVEKSIQARDSELTAYEAATKDNENLKAKVPPVNEKLLTAAAAKEDAHKAAYEAANSKALSELKEFVDKRSAHFDSHVSTILTAQTNLFQTAHTQLSQVIGSESYEKIGVPEEAKTIPDAFSPKLAAKPRRNSKPQPPIPAVKSASPSESPTKLPTISEASISKPEVVTAVETKPKPSEAKPSAPIIYGKPPTKDSPKPKPEPTESKLVPEEKAKPVVRSPGKLAAAATFETPPIKESPKPKPEPRPFKSPAAKSTESPKAEAITPVKAASITTPEPQKVEPETAVPGKPKPAVSPKVLDKLPSPKEAPKEVLPKKEGLKEGSKKVEDNKDEPEKASSQLAEAESTKSAAEAEPSDKDAVDAEIEDFVDVGEDKEEEEQEEEEEEAAVTNFSDLEAMKTERLTHAQRAKKRKTRPPTKGKPIAFAIETKEVIEKVPEKKDDDEDRPEPVEKPKMPMGVMGMKGFQLPAIMPGKSNLRSVARSGPEPSKEPEKLVPALPKLSSSADKMPLKSAPKPAADPKPALPVLKPALFGSLKTSADSGVKARPASMALSGSPLQPTELKTTAKPRPLSAKLSAPVNPEAKEEVKTFVALKKTASEPNASKPELASPSKASDFAKPPSKPPPPKPEAKSPSTKQPPPRPSRT